MSFAKRLSFFALILVLVGIVVVCFSPLLVSKGLRLFAWWKGRAQGVKIEFREIDAPFLKPVVIRGLRVKSARPCMVRIDLAAERATFALNLRTLFFLSTARFLHAVRSMVCAAKFDAIRTKQQNAISTGNSCIASSPIRSSSPMSICA